MYLWHALSHGRRQRSRRAGEAGEGGVQCTRYFSPSWALLGQERGGWTHTDFFIRHDESVEPRNHVADQTGGTLSRIFPTNDPVGDLTNDEIMR